MNFALTGFFQDGTFRVFAFETLPRDRGLNEYWVRADMNLIRQHQIPMQELPLLCRAVLEQRTLTDTVAHTFTYTAAEMKQHALERASADQRRYPRSVPARRKDTSPAGA